MRLQLERVGRLVERDPGPEVVDRDAQDARRRRGCSPPRTAAGRAPPPRTAARCRTGPAPACRGSPAGSPTWRVVRNRLASHRDTHGRATRCARSASQPRGGSTRSRKRSQFARAQPARSTTSWRSTTPGRAAPRRCSSRGTMRSMARAYAGAARRELRGRQAAGGRRGGGAPRCACAVGPVDDAVTWSGCACPARPGTAPPGRRPPPRPPPPPASSARG